MNSRAIMTALAVFALMLTAQPARAGCTKDTDCKGKRICVDGRCVFPSDARNKQKKKQDFSKRIKRRYRVVAPVDKYRCNNIPENVTLWRGKKKGNPVDGFVELRQVASVDFNGDGVLDYVTSVGEGGVNTMWVTVLFHLGTADGYRKTPLLGVCYEKGSDYEPTIDVSSGQVVIKSKTYGPDDPECCPSVPSVLKVRWAGGKLVVDRPGKKANNR